MSPFQRRYREAPPGQAFRWARWRGGDLRVSDADRAEAADRLSRHYSDGRLDEAAFNERLDLAMRATTESDLAALLADLPPTGPPGGAPQPHRRTDRRADGRTYLRPHGRRGHRIGFLLLIVLLAVTVGPALARLAAVTALLSIPWVLIALIAFIWLSRRRRHSRPG